MQALLIVIKLKKHHNHNVFLYIWLVYTEFKCTNASPSSNALQLMLISPHMHEAYLHWRSHQTWSRFGMALLTPLRSGQSHWVRCCVSSDKALLNVFAQGPEWKGPLTQKGPLPAATFTMEDPDTKHSPKCHTTPGRTWRGGMRSLIGRCLV